LYDKFFKYVDYHPHVLRDLMARRLKMSRISFIIC